MRRREWERRRGGRRPGPGWQAAPPLRLAVFAGAVQVIGTTFAAHDQAGARSLDFWGYGLLLAGPVALLFRRRHRVPVVAVTIAAAVTYLLVGYPYGPVVFAPLVAAIGALREGRRVPVWVLTGIGYALCVGLGRLPGVHVRYLRFGEALIAFVVVGVALLLGEAARVQSRYLVELSRTRAEQARVRDEQQRRQSSEERLRIARELHDVLGHHLSLINVQAGVGLHLMDEQPEQARTALLAIKQASAEALREVRSVLGVLRAEDEQAPRAPAPSLANLAALAEDAGAHTVVEGEPRELPAELDRAAYRIAQEALTNVRRHAGATAAATVTIGYRPDGLTVRVEDDGPGGAPEADYETAGNGIAGMRARAAALGGTLTAGPQPAGGFRVEASLPL
jgi:signal transduction histidine kinase